MVLGERAALVDVWMFVCWAGAAAVAEDTCVGTDAAEDTGVRTEETAGALGISTTVVVTVVIMTAEEGRSAMIKDVGLIGPEVAPSGTAAVWMDPPEDAAAGDMGIVDTAAAALVTDGYIVTVWITSTVVMM
jgi:hypothetical protein